ncbi:MAG: DUF2778 domain-containing protein [Polyangiaceae bacterium]|nr:DUF2778 domain-containing protein [Polyangiaceae bacterium]
MAHFTKPPEESSEGYDIDNKLAPGSVWRMQVCLACTRKIALWGGSGLFVRSNNPAVVPNSFTGESTVGSLRIIPITGGSVGTAMLEAGKGQQVWVSLQVQVTENRYASERGDPAIRQCTQPQGIHQLLFDGYYLKMTYGSSVAQAWHARSGKKTSSGKFDYSPARQRSPSLGPIPEGDYWIQPDELASKPAAWQIWRVWGEAGWGNYRITIHPRPGTHTSGRGGFFIHGGAHWGSAGCIDLTYGMDSFAATIRNLTDCHIPLKVNYNGTTVVDEPSK